MLKKQLILIISLTTLLIADPPDWEINPGAYEYNMNLTAELPDVDISFQDDLDMLAAFVGQELRGVRTGANFFPPANTFLFYLQIYSNQYTGEEITFKFYDESSDQVFDVATPTGWDITFQADAIIGDAVTPVELFIIEETNNSVPVAQNGEYSFDEDNMITIYLSATDEDGDALSFMLQESPNNGTVTLSGIAATYYPNANYNGMDSFSFIADDGQDTSNSATINLIIHAVNDAPYLYAVPDAEINAGETFIYNLQAVDVDGDDLAYTAIITSGEGTATLSNNVLTVQGNPNSILEINIIVSDGAATDQISFILTILEEESTCTDDNNDGWCDQFPSITIIGGNILLFNQEQGAEYLDMGATCSDSEDGNISHTVEVSGQVVNMAIPNIYTIHYNCTDSDGNVAQTLNRTVVVVPPPIADENEDGFDDDAFIAGAQSGDINLDGSLNIVDIVFFIDIILNGE